MARRRGLTSRAAPAVELWRFREVVAVPTAPPRATLPAAASPPAPWRGARPAYDVPHEPWLPRRADRHPRGPRRGGGRDRDRGADRSREAAAPGRVGADRADHYPRRGQPPSGPDARPRRAGRRGADGAGRADCAATAQHRDLDRRARRRGRDGGDRRARRRRRRDRGGRRHPARPRRRRPDGPADAVGSATASTRKRSPWRGPSPSSRHATATASRWRRGCAGSSRSPRRRHDRRLQRQGPTVGVMVRAVRLRHIRAQPHARSCAGLAGRSTPAARRVAHGVQTSPT